MLNYICQNYWMLWLCAAFLLLILELSSGDFYLTCFAIGAICSTMLSLVDAPFWVLVLTFAIGSVLSIWLIRPLLLDKLHPKHRQRVSNADAVIGRIGHVSQTIDRNGYGRVKVAGDDWKAQSTHGQMIGEGTLVRVVSRDSVILTVKPEKTDDEE